MGDKRVDQRFLIVRVMQGRRAQNNVEAFIGIETAPILQAEFALGKKPPSRGQGVLADVDAHRFGGAVKEGEPAKIAFVAAHVQKASARQRRQIETGQLAR